MEKQRKNDWASFYEEACAQEKKHNHMLSARLAEAQTRQTELEEKLNRIGSSPLWKFAAPFGRLSHLKERSVGEIVRAHLPQRKESPAQEEVRARNRLHYEQEYERQKTPYLQWISERETEEETGGKGAETPEEIWTLRIPDSDLLLIGYGKGFLNGRIFEKVKEEFNKNESWLMAGINEDFYWKKPENRMEPWFKPCYSPDTLLAFNCFGHIAAVKTELAERVRIPERLEEYRGRGMSAEAGFYDLILRLEENSRWDSLHEIPGVFCRQEKLGRIEEILFHLEYHLPEGTKEELEEVQEALRSALAEGEFFAGAGKECLQVRQEALARRGARAFLMPGPEPGIYHVVYDTAVSGRERCNRALNSRNSEETRFLVSVIIPSKDHPELLEKCLTSFLQKTAYESVEFIIVDNGSNEENRRRAEKELLQKLEAIWEEQEREGKLKYNYIYEEMPFNFSRMCNLGAQNSAGDLLLFLNDDIEIIEESWLGRMVGQALQPHVGAVGARLWYAQTEKLQHAGITNLPIGPSHKLITFADDQNYYYGHNRVTYDMAGVTGACLLLCKSRFEEVGGMDETMAVAYNDVDLCFSLLEKGYYNVLRNDAVLYHHESMSRGLDEEDAGKWDRLLQEKEKLYKKHPLFKGKDPFYSEGLIGNASDYRCGYAYRHEQQLAVTQPEQISPKKLKQRRGGEVRLTIDRAEWQHKIYADEPDLFWIMGWSYLPGADNAELERMLVLQREDGLAYQIMPELWHRADVEAILPMETHIGLAGFAARVPGKSLLPGRYRIGLLTGCADKRGRMQYLTWSSQELTAGEESKQ